MDNDKTESDMQITLKTDSYDTTFILSTVVILVLFNVLEESISCDIQKIIKNKYVKHTIGVVSIFFLFSVIGNKENQHIWTIWWKSIIMYFIFILMAKTEWYFGLPIVALLLIDQSLKIQQEHNNNKSKPYNKKVYLIAREIITYLILGLIFVGFTSYGLKQYQEHKENFDMIKLIFGIGCTKGNGW